jgi:hypothetical protein
MEVFGSPQNAASANGYSDPDTSALVSLILASVLTAAFSARSVYFSARVFVTPLELSTPIFLMTSIPIISNTTVRQMSNASRMLIFLLKFVDNQKTTMIIVQAGERQVHF